MPFVATLTPNANKTPNTANWALASASSTWQALSATGDAAHIDRFDPTAPDGGHASASVYVSALAPHIRRITASASAPPVRIRAWFGELNPGGPINGSHGVGYGASSDGTGTYAVSGAGDNEQSAHDVAQNPDGPRAWDRDDFTGAADSTNVWVFCGGDRPTVINEGIQCYHLRCEVRWEREQQGLIMLDVLLPWIPWAAIGQAFGGLAHARLDPRRIEAWARRASRGLTGWDQDCDQDVLQGLRSWRWPTVVDLGATIAL